MVGNAIQVAKVFNAGMLTNWCSSIFASDQKRKINLNVVTINECFMPVAIGGGINSIDDIHDLLDITTMKWL
ncbi:MAG: HisA/HisF-related TIM barrel protein [Cyclobacteriaceae bacterium]|nr:HisA/HisF-related TIM barrel protein [Cyclobacteriaceae bacterium]